MMLCLTGDQYMKTISTMAIYCDSSFVLLNIFYLGPHFVSGLLCVDQGILRLLFTFFDLDDLDSFQDVVNIKASQLSR